MGEQEDRGPRQWEDILEGVDTIGTLIDRQLPRMAEQLEQITERLDGLSGQLEYGSDSDSGESVLADMRLRLELLEQRFLTFERASEDRFGELVEKLDSLAVTLSEIQEELATLKRSSPGDKS